MPKWIFKRSLIEKSSVLSSFFQLKSATEISQDQDLMDVAPKTQQGLCLIQYGNCVFQEVIFNLILPFKNEVFEKRVKG